MKKLRRLVVTLTVGALATVGTVVATGSPASAHGALMIPGSRTYLCWVDGLQPQGHIVPSNPACAAAIAQSGVDGLYNWFGVLDPAAAGRTVGYVPDGTICSAGNRSPYNFTGYNLARTDWPATRLTSGGSIQMRYNNWAHHPGRFDLYVTRNGWNQSRPLAWSDLESQPFASISNPQQVGPVGNATSYYNFGNVQLPSGKTGRHIIVSHWIRSDSNENFYGCSDVVFDGGNGQVIGIGGTPPTSNPPTTSNPPVTSSPPPISGSPPVTSSPPGPIGNGCTASATVQTQWNGGYVVQPVTVTNAGSSQVGAWTVSFTLPAGHSITGSWNANITVSGQTVTARNLAYNGSLSPGSSTSFGFQASRSGDSGTPSSYSCIPG